MSYKNIPFGKIEVVAVTVSASATSGTGTGEGKIIGYYPSAQDQMVKSIAKSGSTITVTLAAAATADNVINIVLLK